MIRDSAHKMRSCEGKIRFVSESEARHAAHGYNAFNVRLRRRGSGGLRRRGERYRKREVYACRFCGGWHIGRARRRGSR